ncbi:LysR family transcriptional regulator [Acinetobacter gerneri]|uniref:LysR family transcriptional regulator n=1 Tax=Acinetobacter gerneri TaxID=202952 RepID=UPI0028A66E47|nr:LysR family transcriptional regulator [Acinetobacter gerneri]
MIEKISLNSLKFFYFVAIYGSVTLAANKLFVTQSAVSKQIYNLEHCLDLTLFDRKNKSFSLTKDGEILLSCCQKIFSQLDQCLIELTQQNSLQTSLVLSCEPTLSMKWLIPRLAQFKAQAHGFDIVLLTGGGPIDFAKNHIDLAIRRNDFAWGEHIFSEKIADEYIVGVESSHTSVADELLISNSRPHFLKQIKKIQGLKQVLDTSSKTEFEHFYLCLEACMAGLGRSIISIYMIEKELKYQLLKTISPVVSDGSSYHLLSHNAFHEDPRKMIFLEWLKKQMLLSQAMLRE